MLYLLYFVLALMELMKIMPQGGNFNYHCIETSLVIAHLFALLILNPQIFIK